MATAVNTVNIMDALFTKLKTGDFGTHMASKVFYDDAPRNAAGNVTVTLPYCTFSIVDDIADLDTFDRDGFRMRIQVSIWEDDEDGPRVIGDYADDLRTLLHRTVLTITGHAPVPMELEMQRGPLKEDDVWRVDMDWMLAGWKT